MKKKIMIIILFILAVSILGANGQSKVELILILTNVIKNPVVSSFIRQMLQTKELF